MEDIVNGKNVSAAPYLKVEDIYKNFGANKAVSYTHLTLPTKLEV